MVVIWRLAPPRRPKLAPATPALRFAGAILATLFFPLISLIVALLLLGGQSDSRKRASLRMWAWSSGGWLVLQVIVVIAIAVSISHSSSVDRSGPCVGGPDPSATGKDISGNGTRFVVPCTFSGTATVSFP
jgi:fumarate reductase subunit D